MNKRRQICGERKPFLLHEQIVPIRKRKSKELKKKKKPKWGFLQSYSAQGQFWFDALAIYMEFYSSGFSKVQQKQATEQYAISEAQQPFSEPVAYGFKILFDQYHEWTVKKKPFQSCMVFESCGAFWALLYLPEGYIYGLKIMCSQRWVWNQRATFQQPVQMA